ncbi:hypothetical protein C8Q76DRAFT_46751 [Earliella scabrosa]|nr:hypothetical protein C8Q76DRAFT_46751 [Earliella scabrosa]
MSMFSQSVRSSGVSPIPRRTLRLLAWACLHPGFQGTGLFQDVRTDPASTSSPPLTLSWPTDQSPDSFSRAAASFRHLSYTHAIPQCLLWCTLPPIYHISPIATYAPSKPSLIKSYYYTRAHDDTPIKPSTPSDAQRTSRTPGHALHPLPRLTLPVQFSTWKLARLLYLSRPGSSTCSCPRPRSCSEAPTLVTIFRSRVSRPGLRYLWLRAVHPGLLDCTCVFLLAVSLFLVRLVCRSPGPETPPLFTCLIDAPGPCYLLRTIPHVSLHDLRRRARATRLEGIRFRLS